MKNVHAIIYAHHGYSELHELGAQRTGASMPFCGRYRLIDFMLSGLMHAGIHDVGVIMQRGYQSLMDHIGSGRTWNMSRRADGLRLLPPYGMPHASTGFYDSCMEALMAVRSYLDEIKDDYVVLGRGDLCANIDIEKVVAQHINSGVDVTAVCCKEALPYPHHRFTVDDNGMAQQMLFLQKDDSKGVASLEMFVLSKTQLLELVDWCAERGRVHFHRDALNYLFNEGGKVGIYMHEGYARHIISVIDFYEANMALLDETTRDSLFNEDLPITSRERSDVSTYYAETAKVKNSLIADGCIIEGDVENCVIFCGAKVSAGAVVKNCIILNDTVIGENAELNYVISDKNVQISPYMTLNGNVKLPLVIPKDSKL